MLIGELGNPQGYKRKYIINFQNTIELNDEQSPDSPFHYVKWVDLLDLWHTIVKKVSYTRVKLSR